MKNSRKSNAGTNGASRYTRSKFIAIICVALLAFVSLAGVTLISVRSARAQKLIGGGDKEGTKSGLPVSGQTSGISPEGMQQIQALLMEKNSRTPSEQKIDSQLLQAVRESKGQQMVAGVNLQRANVHTDQSGQLAVDIDGDVTDTMVTRIEELGGHIILASFEYKTVRATVPLSIVSTISTWSDVTFIKPAAESITSRSETDPTKVIGGLLNSKPGLPLSGMAGPVGSRHVPTFSERAARVRSVLARVLPKPVAAPMAPTGTVNSEGDRAHRADDTRATYGYQGQGIRIGVLSDTFNSLGGLAADIASGNLPGPGNPLGNTTPVTIVQDLAGGSDEGRAMMQIVHDLAPKAQLFFATADASEAGFASNIIALRNAPNNCNIIIDDVFYYDEPVFQDGIVAQAVNTVTASGALYFSSAGNEGNVDSNTAGVFEGDFNDSGSPAFTFPGGAKSGTIHNFGTVATPVNGDIITAAGQRYTFNWSDPIGASTNDYDLFVVSSAGTVKQSSTNIQNGTQNPYEEITPGTLAAGDRLVVFKTAAAAVRAFSINTIRGTLTLKTTGQTHGHSSALAAFSVAAAPAAGAFGAGSPVGPFPAAYSGANGFELFTSDGPRRIFYNANGTAVTPGNVLFGTNGGVSRPKPDITAADGVSTTLAPGSGLNPFYGTSAAAPHAGAIAGLLLSANPALTPTQVRTILTTSAVDIGAAGYDRDSGFGIVQAFQSMQAVAPTPLATLLVGTTTFTEGSFGNGNSVVDPGEIGNLVIQLSDTSTVTATGVNATLSTTTPGVTIINNSVSYGTIAGGSSVSNSATPFRIAVNSSVPCGSTINFSLTVTFGGGASPQGFFVTGIVGNPPISISGTIGSAPLPPPPSVTATSGQQTGRISRSGVASSCAAPKVNPGLTTAVGSRQFDAYTFTNTGAATCVTVTLTAANGNNLYTAAFNNVGFVPATPSTNYLADSGASGPTQTYSFTAPAGQPFTVVVHDINITPASNSPYTLSVAIPTCSAGGACTPVTITTPSIASGATNTPYTQSFAASGGSGAYNFSLTGTLPAGLSFAGNTLSGTPTQAGSFPITITATDPVGCPAGSQGYTLVIAGNAAASVTVSAGDGQTTIPLTAFATQLKVLVRDSATNPLPGVGVTFTAPASGASGTFPGNNTTWVATSDPSGFATAPVFTANNITGSYVVAATVVGVALPANFNLTNACPSTVQVTSSADSGPGTLREAASFSCPGLAVTFAPAVTSITLTSGEILLQRAITITGPGANLLTISGNHTSRIFNVGAGTGLVSISGMTLTNGGPSGGTTGGGAILVNNGASAGTVNLSGLQIMNNDVTNAGNPLGGGIDNEGGVVNIDHCLIAGNIATFRGGGIQNQGFGSMTIGNSTIVGNTAGSAGIGGGIRSALPLTLTSDTIYANSALTGGNISRNANTITFGNTIIAGGNLVGVGGTGPDINGAGFASADYNLIQNTVGGTITGTTTHNITGIDPALMSLGTYGGPTFTNRPGPQSPVINAGNPSLTSGTDQRSFPRSVGTQTDIGAVETNYSVTATAGTPQSVVVNNVLGTAMQATVTESAQAVFGAIVTFTAPGSGASGLFGASTTATTPSVGGGIATAPAFTANSTPGPYTVTATIGSQITAANFAITNLAASAFAVNDASAVKPSSGSTTMVFTVSLATPATGPVSVNYATAHDTGGAHPAVDGTDYDVSSGTVSFATGDQVKTVSVTIHADAAATTDRTFLMNLSTPSSGTITRAQATGTIKAVQSTKPVLISEFRTTGPGGTNDSYIEIYNNTPIPMVVPGPGWAIVTSGATCGAAPTMIGFVDPGTTIPAFGNYLLIGSQYSLGVYPGGSGGTNGDQVLSGDIGSDANIGIFATTAVATISSANAVDVVGSGSGAICDLLKSGNPVAAALGSSSQYAYLRKDDTGTPQDTGNNAADFLVVSTTPSTPVGANSTPLLGAPGPENKFSPVSMSLTPGIIDPAQLATASPNRVRNTSPYTDVLSGTSPGTSPGPYPLGTLAIRRTYINNTGQPVTRLRFRLIDVTSYPAALPGTADLRAVTSPPSQVVSVTGGGTATLIGLALEGVSVTPPSQPQGGGINTTLTVPTGLPILPGQSINVEFLLGVKQAGTFRFFVLVEGLSGLPG